MRAAFIKALCEVAQKDERTFLLTGDLGYRFLESFQERFPQRYLNVGVAEANLITVAAGLAAVGYRPFAYSIATFASMRAFEQVRNDVSLQNLNVTIVGIGGGLAYAKAGPTHHSMEDIALMRTLPNMTIIAPADPLETEAAVRALSQHKGPAYLRLEHNPPKNVYQRIPVFTIGKGSEHRKGTKVALIATGTKVALALSAAELLAKKRLNVGIFALPTIQPLDTQLLAAIAKRYGRLVTIEEHRVSGGLGTAVAEFLQEANLHKTPKLLRLGLQNTFSPVSANYETLTAFFGLTPEYVAHALLKYAA